MSVKRCVSCGADHDFSEVVLDEGRVWYRCNRNSKTLIYIREAKGVPSEQDQS